MVYTHDIMTCMVKHNLPVLLCSINTNTVCLWYSSADPSNNQIFYFGTFCCEVLILFNERLSYLTEPM